MHSSGFVSDGELFGDVERNAIRVSTGAALWRRVWSGYSEVGKHGLGGWVVREWTCG